MKNKAALLFVALAVVFAGVFTPAMAAPLCLSGGSMTAYLAPSYSCQIGGELFSGFSLNDAAVGLAPVTAAAITVDTVGPAGSGAAILGPDSGLQFVANWTATPGETLDDNIMFDISIIGGPGPVMITDAGLAQVAGVVTDGSATVVEQGCSGAPCAPNVWGTMVLNVGTGYQNSISEVFFAPTDSIVVDKDIGVSGGNTGYAHLSLVSDTFSVSQVSPVPESGTMAMLGVGLIGLGYCWRRRRGFSS